MASLEMLSGRSKKEYAKEVQSAAEDPDAIPASNGASTENDLEAVVAMCSAGRRARPLSRAARPLALRERES